MLSFQSLLIIGFVLSVASGELPNFSVVSSAPAFDGELFLLFFALADGSATGHPADHLAGDLASHEFFTSFSQQHGRPFRLLFVSPMEEDISDRQLLPSPRTPAWPSMISRRGHGVLVLALVLMAGTAV